MNIFVFGSNLAGVHGAGAALFALKNHGASMRKAEGLSGTSYAIPTCDAKIRPLSLEAISEHVNKFIAFAEANPDMQFQVTRIGCGIAGFKDSDIAPLFSSAPPNCLMPPEWGEVMGRKTW